MRRSSALALILLASACGPKEERPAASTPVLTAPEKVPGPVVSTQAYDNESQARLIQDEAGKLGIEGLAKPGSQEDRPPVSYDEGLQRTKDYAKILGAQRRALDQGKPKGVALPGATPRLLSETSPEGAVSR